MNLPVAIADPNADMEAWIKTCPRDLLERMYIFMFNQASQAMEARTNAEKQLKAERELPDKYRGGIWAVRTVDGERISHWIAGFDSVQRYLNTLERYSGEDISEVINFLLDMTNG